MKKRKKRKTLKERRRDIADSHLKKKHPLSECCWACGKYVSRGYISIGRWHKVQRFHATKKCSSKIQEYVNKVLIDELNKEYKGYNILKKETDIVTE